MIEASRTRGIYDELVQADVVQWLASSVGAVDLLLAADLLIYLGTGAPVCRGGQPSAPGGLFAFSIELTTEPDYVLRPTRRYAHSVGYTGRLAASLGWSEVASLEQPLRRQDQSSVDGQLFVFRSR